MLGVAEEEDAAPKRAPKVPIPIAATPPLFSTPKNTDKAAWGPQLWHSLHMIALNYPDRPSASDKLNYKLFFESLKDVIPCLACADNYTEHLNDMPIDRHLDSAGSLFSWTIDLHNLVNESHGKPKWTAEEALTYYAGYRPSSFEQGHHATPNTHKASASVGGSSDLLQRPMGNTTKDLLATGFMLFVIGILAVCLLLMSWYAFTYARRTIRK
jgi:Erv1 / Alr family